MKTRLSNHAALNYSVIHPILLQTDSYFSCEHAFENVGVDFVGPLYYKVSNNEMRKCYILLFPCAVSRDTHLELTTNVGTDSVILALRIFIGRRGKPNHIISDNFKSFKGISLLIKASNGRLY